MARVIRSPAAKRDLKEISQYIAKRSGIERARTVLRNIARKMELHATQPNAAQQRDALRPGLRSFSVYDYIVFYIPIKDGIDVKRVLHGSRDLEAMDYNDEDDT